MNDILDLANGTGNSLLERWKALRHSEVSPLHIATGAEIASTLASQKKFERFRVFIDNLSLDEYALLHGAQMFIKAVLQLHHHEGNHAEVIRLIKNGTFQDSTGLLELWDASHYAIREVTKGRPLTSLERHRVRKRFPPPVSICPGGSRPSNRPSQESVKTLQGWLNKHQNVPYPTTEERAVLAHMSGMSDGQVKMWFANARRRMRQRLKIQENVNFSPTCDSKVTSENSDTHLSVSKDAKPQLGSNVENSALQSFCLSVKSTATSTSLSSKRKPITDDFLNVDEQEVQKDEKPTRRIRRITNSSQKEKSKAQLGLSSSTSTTLKTHCLSQLTDKYKDGYQLPGTDIQLSENEKSNFLVQKGGQKPSPFSRKAKVIRLTGDDIGSGGKYPCWGTDHIESNNLNENVMKGNNGENSNRIVHPFWHTGHIASGSSPLSESFSEENNKNCKGNNNFMLQPGARICTMDANLHAEVKSVQNQDPDPVNIQDKDIITVQDNNNQNVPGGYNKNVQLSSSSENESLFQKARFNYGQAHTKNVCIEVIDVTDIKNTDSSLPLSPDLNFSKNINDLYLPAKEAQRKNRVKKPYQKRRQMFRQKLDLRNCQTKVRNGSSGCTRVRENASISEDSTYIRPSQTLHYIPPKPNTSCMWDPALESNSLKALLDICKSIGQTGSNVYKRDQNDLYPSGFTFPPQYELSLDVCYPRDELLISKSGCDMNFDVRKNFRWQSQTQYKLPSVCWPHLYKQSINSPLRSSVLLNTNCQPSSFSPSLENGMHPIPIFASFPVKAVAPPITSSQSKIPVMHSTPNIPSFHTTFPVTHSSRLVTQPHPRFPVTPSSSMPASSYSSFHATLSSPLVTQHHPRSSVTPSSSMPASSYSRFHATLSSPLVTQPHPRFSVSVTPSSPKIASSYSNFHATLPSLLITPTHSRFSKDFQNSSTNAHSPHMESCTPNFLQDMWLRTPNIHCFDPLLSDSRYDTSNMPSDQTPCPLSMISNPIQGNHSLEMDYVYDANGNTSPLPRRHFPLSAQHNQTQLISTCTSWHEGEPRPPTSPFTRHLDYTFPYPTWHPAE